MAALGLGLTALGGGATSRSQSLAEQDALAGCGPVTTEIAPSTHSSTGSRFAPRDSVKLLARLAAGRVRAAAIQVCECRRADAGRYRGAQRWARHRRTRSDGLAIVGRSTTWTAFRSRLTSQPGFAFRSRTTPRASTRSCGSSCRGTNRAHVLPGPIQGGLAR